jgi:pyruvate/2-oxoacid:ferredoxin oxidoreductase beta subunit
MGDDGRFFANTVTTMERRRWPLYRKKKKKKEKIKKKKKKQNREPRASELTGCLLIYVYIIRTRGARALNV